MLYIENNWKCILIVYLVKLVALLIKFLRACLKFQVLHFFTFFFNSPFHQDRLYFHCPVLRYGMNTSLRNKFAGFRNINTNGKNQTWRYIEEDICKLDWKFKFTLKALDTAIRHWNETFPGLCSSHTLSIFILLTMKTLQYFYH